MADFSVIIPGRNEEFHARTIADVLEHTSERTEVIAVLDGQWSPHPIPIHPRLRVVYLPEAIGQRAATNLGARISASRWIAKLDAHCSVPQGWDQSLIRTSEELGRDVTIIPQMYNLHAFSWKCDSCGEETYQGPKPTTCFRCKSAGPFSKQIVWQKRGSRLTQYWRLNGQLEFAYWGAFKDRPEAKSDVVDVMTSIGACFFMERERFWELGGLDEDHGSWGFFGAEVALKSQLSGGRHVVTKRTWFAHMFRTQNGFSFPYPLTGNDQQRAKEYGRKMWFADAWPGQKLPLRSVVEKYWPIPGWTEEQRNALPLALSARPLADTPSDRDRAAVVLDAAPGDVHRGERERDVRVSPAKGLIYYTDNRGDDAILNTVRAQIAKACNGYPVVSASLQPLSFGRNIVLSQTRGHLAMFRQILAGLEALDTTYAFLVEHDVLYSPLHFQFTPPRDDVYYYQTNVWHVDAKTGRAITYLAKRTSQVCANRELLVAHYRKRVEVVERQGFSTRIGFEPGSHGRKERIDDVQSDTWHAAVPNIDIRHSANLTKSRWSPEEFNDQRNCQGWQESDSIPSWGKTLGCFPCFLKKVHRGELPLKVVTA